MRLVFVLLSSLFFYSFCWGHEWQITEGSLKFSKRNIEFSNRAQCAKQSLLPTRSVYMLLDNVNIGKALYRLAKHQGRDSKEFINYGLQVYRSGLSRLSRMIATGLLNGELGLIEGTNFNDEVLSSNWLKYQNKKTLGISCSSIKKISTIQKSLSTSRPDQILLQELAMEQASLEKYFGSCDEADEEASPELGLLLFDIPYQYDFANRGFKFWSSFKIYLSWAFRNASEMTTLMYPFDFLFKSLHLEEMVLIFSASCESITPPECSNNELSLEKIRTFTKPSKNDPLASNDFLDSTTDDFASTHFSPPLPLKEDDLLNFLKVESSEQWIRTFRDGLVSTRGYIKLKLKSALNKLKLISSGLKVGDILRKINAEIKQGNPDIKQELFYLCTEYRIAFSPDFNLINNSFNQLKNYQGLPPFLEGFDISNFHELKSVTEILPQEIMKTCQQLEMDNFWNKDESINHAGLAYWYRRLVDQESTPIEINPILWQRKVEKPFLAVNNDIAICSTGAHCAREALDSLIILAKSIESFEAFLPKEQINSTNMVNPYAARMSCGLYDPWEKQHQVVNNFLGDLFTASVMSVTPVPIYVSASIDPKKVSSFNSLLKDNKIFYSPKYDKRKIHLSLLADLGPLTGIPCAISITGSQINPFEYYMFKGISLTQCWERSKNELIVESSDDFDKKDQFKQGCVGCAINIETIASSASMINPIFRGSYFLLKGIVKLASELKRPQDLPRDWKVSPQQVALSYRYHGEISKKCARKLIKGKNCLPLCGNDLIEKFTSKYQVTPIYSDFNCLLKKGRIFIKECSEPVDISQRGDLKLVTNCRLEERK